METGSSAVECPVCEYPHARLRYRLPDRFFGVSEGPFRLYACGSCGLLFQRPEELGELEALYPAGYWWQESGRLGRLERIYREWMVRHDQLDFVLQSLRGREGGRLLDIGCGSGTFLKLARQAGLEVHGLEFSAQAAALAGRQSGAPVSFGTEKELMERGDRFDTITLFHVLEHLPDPFRYLKDLRHLLREKGRLVLQVPNCASWQARVLGPLWFGLDVPRHIHNFSTFALLHLVGRAGYRLHRVRHFSWRDNAAALVSSGFRGIDPMSSRVRMLRKGRPANSFLAIKEALYFVLVMAAQPLAALEAAAGRGATITIDVSLE